MKSLLLLGSNAPHVHLRLRKRLSRCTLDCGFKTPESPALRGFVAERGPIRGTSLYLVLKSNGLHRPKIRLKKFGFSPKIVPANISKKLPAQVLSQIVFHPVFQPLAQMAHVRFHRQKRVHARLRSKNRTQRLTRRNRGRFGWGVVSLLSERSARFGNPAWPGDRTADFAVFGPWPGVLPKNAESLRDSDAIMRVAVPRHRGPTGLRCWDGKT